MGSISTESRGKDLLSKFFEYVTVLIEFLNFILRSDFVHFSSFQFVTFFPCLLTFLFRFFTKKIIIASTRRVVQSRSPFTETHLKSLCPKQSICSVLILISQHFRHSLNGHFCPLGFAGHLTHGGYFTLTS